MCKVTDALKCVDGTVLPRKLFCQLKFSSEQELGSGEDALLGLPCASHSSIAFSSRYWNGIVPERCKLQFKEGEEWNCFFGYKIYPTLRCKCQRREIKWFRAPSAFVTNLEQSLFQTFCLSRPSLCCPVAVRRGPAHCRQCAPHWPACSGRTVALHPEFR